MKTILLILSSLFFVFVNNCIIPSPLTLQLMIEYAKWRSWDQIVLFDNLSSKNCVLKYARPLMTCLAERGISVSIQSATNPNIPVALTIRRHRIGSIVLLDGLNLTSSDNVLHVASQKLLFNYYVSWFMITARNTDTTIDAVLKDLNIGIDSDVVVATSSNSQDVMRELTLKYRNRTCSNFRQYGQLVDFQNLSERRNSDRTMNLDYITRENRTMCFHFLHVYKIRNSDNSSLVVYSLGSWCPGLFLLKNPMSVKLRKDFKGWPIIFGVLNGTNDGQTDITDEVEVNDIVPLLDFANSVTHDLNASMELIPHDKLGTLTNKVWSNLLGDVVAGTVDVGLGYITINEERLGDMAFSHPLIRYMRNVYYHPLETGTMRDIFLQPFNDRLLGCVAATYFLILLSMGTIIYVAKRTLHPEEEKNVGLGEAALWCMSIMCMQGSPWIPKSPSGKTLLLFSLVFALVTYNAYAGFITSILSVQASGIKSITDLLFNNFKLGYSITDDEYIRNVNDSHLRQLYIKAFNNRESRLGATTGLMKAAQGRYGFFVSATLARRVLRTTFIQERCSLKELPLPQTFTLVALPMANTCPYKKIINLSILRIQEHGVLRRIAEKMLPEMPRCKAPTTFNSARFADVYSAFLILIVGLITAVSIGIFERIWNKRKQMQDSIVRGFREHHFIPHMPHIHFHYHHRHHQQLDHHPLPHNTNHHSNRHPSHHGYHNDHSFQPYFINDHSNKPATSYFINYPNFASKNSEMISMNRKKPNESLNVSSIMKNRSSVKHSSSIRKRSANNISKRAFWASFVGTSQKQSNVTIDKRDILVEKTIKTENTEENKKNNSDVLPFRL
ncbi:uncharacterized protein LOC118446041 isoform X2 [Vespa mandarinia]|uniref:uncharacterized protein LOC118446041 isoform X2 n=1 Tax=Vespa mandarinia TaxID=7446 RepID=UPI0016175E3C|nr:uncharacterized protein LOC118446041 isoform X2 [Vespa mandarinia]